VISGSILGSFLETLELGNDARSGTNRICENDVLPPVLQVKSKVDESQIATFWLPGKTFSGSSNEVVCVLAEGSEKCGKGLLFGSILGARITENWDQKRGPKNDANLSRAPCGNDSWVPLKPFNPSIPWIMDEEALEYSTSCREGTVADIERERERER